MSTSVSRFVRTLSSHASKSTANGSFTLLLTCRTSLIVTCEANRPVPLFTGQMLLIPMRGFLTRLLRNWEGKPLTPKSTPCLSQTSRQNTWKGFQHSSQPHRLFRTRKRKSAMILLVVVERSSSLKRKYCLHLYWIWNRERKRSVYDDSTSS
jgi:hypothetical protein